MDLSRVIHLSKLGYYTDFVLYPCLAAFLTAYALAHAWPNVFAFGLSAVIGLVAWTLIEYVFHRFVYHEVPYFRDMHDVHHDDPTASVGTPSWASLSAMAVGIFLPVWFLGNTEIACGAGVGIIVGYYWYIVIHHGTHRWTPRPGTYFYRAWKHHARHHFDKRPGNFGVTSSFWDHVFGTALEAPPKP